MHQREIVFIENLGLQVVRDAALGIDTNDEMARLTPDALADWALAHQDDQADGYFLSCTALRTAELIAPLEARLGRPVLTSNQAMVWHALRDSGVEPTTGRWGRLMDN